MVKKYKPYLSSVLLACAVGALSGFLSRNGMQEFQTSVLKPPLTPPPILFPIVWTILYVLMGLGAALVAQSPSGRSQRTALRIYALQLAVNFFWSILFFNFSAYFAAFLWLILLWVLVLLMIWSFAGVNPRRGAPANPLPAVVNLCRLPELGGVGPQPIDRHRFRRIPMRAYRAGISVKNFPHIPPHCGKQYSR